MKVLSFVLPVLISVVALIGMTSPVKAQLPFYQVAAIYDPTHSGGSTDITAPGTASYTIDTSTMEVSTAASGSGYIPPGYFGEANPTSGTYDITAEWGSLTPAPTEFIVGVSGSVSANDTINTGNLTAFGSANSSILFGNTTEISANTASQGPPFLSHNVSSNLPSGTQLIIAGNGQSSGTSYVQVSLTGQSIADSGSSSTTVWASSSASSDSKLQIDSVTEE